MRTSTRKVNAEGVSRGAIRRDAMGRRLISQVELLQMRLSAAAATWKQAKEQASQAKRRRKLAKLLAKRAKKDAKEAKDNLDELREALAAAQTRAKNPLRSAGPRSRQTKGGPAAPKAKRPRSAARKSAASISSEAPQPAEGVLNDSTDAAPPPEPIAGETPAIT